MSTSTQTTGLMDRVPSELRSPGATIIDVFWDRARSGRSQPALHWSTAAGWQAMTWEGYEQAVAEVALGLRELGLEAGDRVGILAGNRPEWHIVDLAILASRMVSVPVYATNAANQVAYVLQHSGARACFVEDDDQLSKVLLHRSELTALEHVVAMEPAERLHDDGFVRPLSEVRALGAAKREREPDAFGQLVDALSPSDLATIVYTSGTTGRPKGAMITHANLMATMRSLTSLIELRPTDRFLSFLPLSHITERCVSHFGQLASGGQTWFARSLATVATDLQTCRPTLFFAVPRVWEKFRDGVLEHVAVQHGVRRALAERYLAVATAGATDSHRGGRFTTEVQRQPLDWVVGRAIRRQLGLDKARMLSCGAAPVHPGLLRWFHAIGLPIAEGYGQTEVSLCTSLNPADAIRIGTVGPPIPGVSVRIAVDGEILVKAPNVCVGYWHDKAATDALIDRDGWLHTGDLGSLDDLGYLSVTGRKKDLIITAYGKNIQPEEIETRLRVEPLISQAVVVGDDRPYLTALLTIDTQAAAEWAGREGRSARSRSADGRRRSARGGRAIRRPGQRRPCARRGHQALGPPAR